MGNCCQKKKRVILLGLEFAGKTSILVKLYYNKPAIILPTMGFNNETISYKKLKIHMFDIGGRKRVEILYRHYYPGADGLLFVVDSTNVDQIGEAKDMLHSVIPAFDDDAFVCVIANKRDLVDRCMSISDIRTHLQLSLIPSSHKWTLIETSAHSGAGLDNVLEWISEQTKK